MNGNWFVVLLSLVSIGITISVLISSVIEYKVKKYEQKSENNVSHFSDWKSKIGRAHV